MKKINISTPKYPNTFALVDDEDFKRINKFKWSATKHVNNETMYATRTEDYTTILMHRMIMKCPDFFLDHEDRDGLNNQKSNLRHATVAENGANRRLHRNNLSGYKGVYWVKKTNRWRAHIGGTKSRVYIGSYTCLIKAARAYDEAARKIYGKFARLNFPTKCTNGIT